MLHFFWCGYSLRDDSYQVYESSNAEIPKWAEYYLGQKTGFHQSNWLNGKVTENPNDILLGHPTWYPVNSSFKRNWVKDNALKLDAVAHPNTYILMPWVPNFPQEWVRNLPFIESQLESAHKIFALCGSIWITKTNEASQDSIQFRNKDKLIHCNMGVASQSFKISKTQFNQIGVRQVLHISHLGSYKGFDITCQSLDGLDTLLHVGSRNLSGSPGLTTIEVDGKDYMINFIGAVNNNDHDFNQWVVENCDFYIHTATMDAQATTILENCCRGLIPLVTPESGFSCPHAIYLTHDPDQNRDIIRWALNLPEDELLERSRLIRDHVRREHSWEDIFNTVWSGIQEDIAYRADLLKSQEPSVFIAKSSPIISNDTETPKMQAKHSQEMKADQRIFLSKNDLFELEKQVRLERHVERYALLRQFAKGVICDAACGCGYGSYLLATNPDVERVIGLDMSEDAINHANQEYASSKIRFEVADLDTWVTNEKIDTLISVETIEHLEDTTTLPLFVERNKINHLIITYPSKKTTHYNIYHHHDFKLQDILDLFSKFTCYKHFNWEYEFDVVFLLRNSDNN